MAEITVLSVGVAGISAAWHAKKRGKVATVFEAKERWGGLLDHFHVEGFRFYNADHFTLSSNDDYRAIQFEIYHSRHKPLAMGTEDLIEHVISHAERLELARRADVVVADYRTLPYGNVVFDLGMVEKRDFVLDYIKHNGILPVGRFGE